MKTMNYSKFLFATGMIAAFALSATPALAKSAAAATVASSTMQKMANPSARQAIGQQVVARIYSLNQLSARVQTIAYLTTDEKSTLTHILSSDIASLNAFKEKISTEATTSLKADFQSFTKKESTYAFVKSQIMILTAADRAKSIGDMFTAFESKIATRLVSTPNAKVTSLLANLQTNVADAQKQAVAAISEISSLKPDNGVDSVQASNATALKDARSKIKAAQSDLKDAYQDMSKITKALKAMAPSASTSAE